MNYRLATENETEQIYDLVQHTIKTIYPKYYPQEVVDFFCDHHSSEAVARDVKSGNVSVLVVDGEMVGTGSFVDNHITRVYVFPEHQKKGYGSFIIKRIEEEICKNYEKAQLDASLPAAALYEKLGYRTIKHEKYPVENGVILAYEIMEKELRKVNTDINYDGSCFVPKIREIKESDLQGLLELYMQLHDNPMPENSKELMDLWQTILQDKNHHIIVAEEEGKIVSSCVCVIVPNLTHNRQPYAFVENVITDAAFRGKGLATACLNYAKEIAEKNNCYKLMLMTGSKKESTLKFYENAGYNRNDKTAFIQWV